MTELFLPGEVAVFLREEREGAVGRRGHNVRALHLKHSQKQALPEEWKVGDVVESPTDLCHMYQVHLPKQRENMDQDFRGEIL